MVQNARFPKKISNSSPYKNPSGFVGFHSRVRVFPGFSSKVGFGFQFEKNSRGRVFVGFGLDPLHHYALCAKKSVKAVSLSKGDSIKNWHKGSVTSAVKLK